MHITGFLKVAGDYESLFLNLLTFVLHKTDILVKYLVNNGNVI